jgi:hypothetical protein
MRDLEAECAGGLQIDHQLEFGRLPGRQLGRFGALQDLGDVAGREPCAPRQVGAVAEKSASAALCLASKTDARQCLTATSTSRASSLLADIGSA